MPIIVQERTPRLWTSGFRPGRKFDFIIDWTVWWWHHHSPSYVLIAFSEIFASITGLEYAYTKAPKNMKSLVMAVFLFTSALASALGEAFVCELVFFGNWLSLDADTVVNSSFRRSSPCLELRCYGCHCIRHWYSHVAVHLAFGCPRG